MMDTRSEDNAQDMEFLTQTAAGVGTAGILCVSQIGLAKYFDKQLRKAADKSVEKALLKKYFGSQLGMIFAGLAAGIGFILWGNTKTKEASRLGRYQAKTRDLQDEKNFVQFTPEQIAQAEKIAATMPDEKQKKGLMRAIKNVKEMYKDMPAYRNHKNQLKNNSAAAPVQQNLTKEQLAQAEKDKELLLNVIKKINNTAEDYSENVENAFDTIQATSWLSAIPIGFGLNKLFRAMKLNIPKGKVAAGISLLFPLATSIWSLTAEKKASRVGRYVAKQEILKNPELLRKFSDEDMKSVEHIKAKQRPKGFFKKIAENFKFIPQYMKDKKAYEKYIKKERPKHEKLNKALLQVKVSDEQLKEAKHLQEKTFMSFDKIDEMSQRYSEDMEAASEIGKNLVTTGFSLAGIGAMITGCVLFVKGKFPMHKIIKLISKVTFKKTSPIRQTTDEFYRIINKDKGLKRAFNKLLSPAQGKKEAAQKLLENTEIQNAIKQRIMNNNIVKSSKELYDVIGKNYGLREEFYQIISSAKDQEALKRALAAFSKNPEISEIIERNPALRNLIDNPNELVSNFKANFASQLNDNFFARWGRNLLAEIGILKLNSAAPYSMEKAVIKETDKILEKVTGRKITNTYSRYKTLINTSIIAGIPVLGVLVGIPYAICSWLTNVQKKAGKIGVMKAIKELDNANLYVNHNYNPQKTNNSENMKQEQKVPNKDDIMKGFLKK